MVFTRSWRFTRSAFGQTVLVIGIVLLVNQVVSYATVGLYVIKPATEQLNQLLGRQVQQLYEQVESNVETDKPLLERLQQYARPGELEVYSTEQAQQLELEKAVTYDFLSRQMAMQLGSEAKVRIRSGNPYWVWVQPNPAEAIWIKIPLSSAGERKFSLLNFYFLVIGILSVATGWWFARKQTQPLLRLQKSAIDVSKGNYPSPLPLQGSIELCEVIKAFNMMSLSMQNLEDDRRLLLAGISHDLRTPLTRLRLAIEMLPIEDRECIEELGADIDDMNDIIDQFIAYIRTDSSEQYQAVPIDEMLAQLCSSEARRFQSITQQLHAGIDVPLQPIAFKRLLDNIIENAHRYGDGELTVTSGIRGSSVVINIIDNGPGMNEQEKRTLFEPFKRGDSARGSKGTGLGLAIIKRIIELHGGTISLLDAKPHGLNIEIVIPIKGK